MAPVTNSTGLDTGGLACTTPACLGLAADIFFNLAANYTEIDPCTDFDKLACDGFRRKSVPSAGSGQASTFNSDSVQALLKNILENPYPSGPATGFISESLSADQVAVDRDNFKLTTDAYNACLNYTAVEAAGLAPLIAVLDLIEEAFPKKKPEDLITKDDNLGKVLLLFTQHSIPTFELIQPSWDEANSVSIFPVNRTIIRVLPAGGSPLTPDTPDETVDKYLAIQASVLRAVHPANLTEEAAAKLASGVTKFEIDAANLGEFDDSKDGKYQPYKTFTLEQVTSVAPELGHDFVIKSMAPPGYTPTDLVFSPGYFGNLSVLLSNTTADTLKGFFIWKAVRTLAGYVEAEVMEPLVDIRGTLLGLDPNLVGRAPRWKRCVSHVEEGASWIELSNGLGWILGRFFVDKAYSKAARELTTNLMSNIQTEFITRLADREWLSAGVKKIAEEKVRAITKKIGYPDVGPNTVDPKDIAKHYSDFKVSDSYFNNTVSAALWFTGKLWSQLGTPTDKGIWLFSPSVVNAFYFPEFNDIFIQAGIQQQPLYDVDYPSYINYGGMGAVLGHELTHGFDDQGHNYGPDGSFTNWFDESSEKAFQERAQCFAKQYDEFAVTAPNGTLVHVEGNFTLGENIADSGGLTTSYAAWKRQQASGTTQDYNLPGLGNFTHDQLFFIKYAQSWCDVSSARGFDVWLIKNDPHSPGFARIKGPLDNSKEFKTAFNCPVKEPRCELW
ncbi:peptidase family M13 (endothelin-converting enzyme 1) [Colletotrichum truncatum]|uniref:Peptidase family M13 (Endothelin-converting enzyme 1) n=1 Tax=Colletotrichum truncatum TaxID=5467 RepID=A0ACC3YN69_COLTU|nr:peptidase family M13 (endothelin-converting enzyme 1) [Colletotrichum truncatum]KAF6789554.1 peptidase family M13 (endothelin-converting enzyme 1) [Colletotrichum truncatum]